MKKKFTTALCAIALLSSVTSMHADDKSLDIMADAALVRPGCLAATIIGAAVFVVVLPVAATSKSVKKTADVLVVRPAKATFTRPMGSFTSLQE